MKYRIVLKNSADCELDDRLVDDLENWQSATFEWIINAGDTISFEETK